MQNDNVPGSGPSTRQKPVRLGFIADFKRFFVRGLAAILPTLITLWLLGSIWDFLWNSIGQHIITFVQETWYNVAKSDRHIPLESWQFITYYLNKNDFRTRALGVGLSVLMIYILGVLVGNLIGRTAWKVVERAVLRIPLVRAIYPAVKQVTDFLLAERSLQFEGSRVVAVQPHEQNIWSIGMITSARQWNLNESGPEEMVTVFVPSTPTSFSGYVLVVPRKRVVELPMTVEEAMRLLVSGGVIMPTESKTAGNALPSEPVSGNMVGATPPNAPQGASTPARIAPQPLGQTA
jgi:uncharacterized membrane protein